MTWGVAWGVAWSAVWLGLVYMTSAAGRGRGPSNRDMAVATEAVAEAVVPDDFRACVDYIMLYVMQNCPANAAAAAA